MVPVGRSKLDPAPPAYPAPPAFKVTVLAEYGAHASLRERAGLGLERLWDGFFFALASLAAAIYGIAFVGGCAALLIGLLIALPTLLAVPVGLAAALAAAHVLRRWWREYARHRSADQASASARSARNASRATPPRAPAQPARKRVVTPLAAGLRCPTLVPAGDDDRLTPARQAVPLVEAISGARLVVLPRTGHMMSIERPDETLDAMRDFLAGAAR